jgi:Cu+-exporting ATPase
METIQWKVEGMTCGNCALAINKYLQKSGAKDVSVNPVDGDVSFKINGEATEEKLAQGVNSLGYKVAEVAGIKSQNKPSFLSTNLQRFWFCLPFTVVLMSHMIPGFHFHWLMNHWVQMGLSLPPFIVGMHHFGRSAIKSIRNGLPNMNVLITIGAASAFFYSLAGTLMGLGDDYLFYETAATIITLVFFGEYLEHASVQSTQRSLKALVKSQKVMANMIAFDENHQEVILPLENTALKVGDLILIRPVSRCRLTVKFYGAMHR